MQTTLGKEVIMKQKFIELGSDLLLSFMNHWVVIAVAMTLTGVCKFEKPHLILWLALWLLPVCLYITRKKGQNFYLFFFLQLLPLAIVCNVRLQLGLKLILILITAFYIVCSIKIRLSEISEEFVIAPAVSVCIMGATYIIEDFFIGRGWGGYYFLIVFVYLVAYFFYFFVSQYLSFIFVNKNSASNIPEQDIFISGMKQTGVYVVSGMVILLLGANIEWLSYIMGMLGRGLVAVIRFWVSLLHFEKSETNPMPSEQGVNGGMGPFMEGGETHPFWILLEKIVTVAVFVGAAVLLVVAIIKGYQYLRNNFRKIGKKKYKEVQGNQDIRESCEIEVSRNEGLGWFPFLNNKEKIRKMYRKRMLKDKSSIVGEASAKELEYLTAKECCDKISADSLKAIYEKARYSNESVTAEDVKRVKAIQRLPEQRAWQTTGIRR